MNCASATQAARNEGGSKHERVIKAHAKSRDRSAAARDCASLQFRARSKAGYPDTCCRSIRTMIPYAKFRTRQKVGWSARCRAGGPRGDRKRHGASERGADRRRSPDISPSSLSSRFYVFARASARRGECRGRMITRVFLTQKARKPTPKYGGACGAPCNRRRPRPGLSLSSWWDNHFQNCDSRLQIRRERDGSLSRTL